MNYYLSDEGVVMWLSTCCNQPVKVNDANRGFREGKTYYYLCTECGKPCNVLSDKKLKEEGIVLILPPLTTLNEYIDAERRNKFIGAKIKKMETETVAWIAKSTLKPMEIEKIDVTFRVKDKRTDKDNLLLAMKFILDGLVVAGIIKNDSWAYTPDNWHFHFELSDRHEIEVRLT